MKPLLVEVFEDFAEAVAATTFVVAIFSIAELAQAGNQEVAIGQSIGSDAVGNAGGHDLLGATAAHPEEEFDGGAIDERTGEGLEGTDNVGDFGVPDWFCRHGEYTMLVRRCAKCKLSEWILDRDWTVVLASIHILRKHHFRPTDFGGCQDQSIPKRDLVTGFHLHRRTDVRRPNRYEW